MIAESSSGDKEWLERPKLRQVELFPVQSPDGRRLIGLRDPFRLAERPLFFSFGALTVLSLLDGTNDLRDIQAELMRRHGELVDLDVITNLLLALDENLYMEGRTFEDALAREMESYATARIRPAILSGQAYPEDPEALSLQLREYYHHPSGPGAEHAAMPGRDAQEGKVLGMVAPHIDFMRGGPCYAWPYHYLGPDDPPTLAVILGTAHSPMEKRLTACDKDFDTPYGPVACALDLVREFMELTGPLSLTDVFAHRGEHSVEFQTVWLAHRLAGRSDDRILPLLCGSFHEYIEAGGTPEEDREYMSALTGLADMIGREAGKGQRVLILAAADLSHVGPQFGGEVAVSPAVAREVEAGDRDVLAAAAAGDFNGFFGNIAGRGDRTNICGLSCIYTMLRLLDGRPGRLLAYDQWIDEAGRGLVSFAGMLFP